MAVALLDQMRILIVAVKVAVHPQVTDGLSVDALSPVVNYYYALDVSMGDSNEPEGTDTAVRPMMTQGMAEEEQANDLAHARDQGYC